MFIKPMTKLPSLADIDLWRTYRAIDSVATGRIPSIFCGDTGNHLFILLSLKSNHIHPTYIQPPLLKLATPENFKDPITNRNHPTNPIRSSIKNRHLTLPNSQPTTSGNQKKARSLSKNKTWAFTGVSCSVETQQRHTYWV